MEQGVNLSDQAHRNKIECFLWLRTCFVKDKYKYKVKVQVEEVWGELISVVIHTSSYIHIEHL